MTPPTVRVFVNERPLELPAGATVGEAVRRFDRDLGERLARGEAYVTDGRGIRVGEAASVHGGAIFRVVVSNRRAVGRGDADA